MINKKREIGLRLKEFALKKFSSLAEFSRKMGKHETYFTAYFKGDNVLGGESLSKLNELGCDINWLLTGKTSNPYNLVPIDEAEKNHIPPSLSFPILGEIPAGISEIRQYEGFFEYFDFELDPRKHGVLRIDNEFGYSMMPLVGPGDLAIISFDDKPSDGDWVAARWDDTKGALKVLAIDKDNPEIIVLNSYNTAVQPIILNSKKQKITLWKVPVVIRASKRR